MIELLWMRYGPLKNLVRSQVLSGTGHGLHAAVIRGIRNHDAEKAANALRADIDDAAISIRQAIEAQVAQLRDTPI